MEHIIHSLNRSVKSTRYKEENTTHLVQNNSVEAFSELERGVYAALETYSNVHRGSGHNSMVTTQLYEYAREIVLEHLELSKSNYVVIFCTPRRAKLLETLLKPGYFKSISSRDIGLPLGITALAVKRRALPGGVPFQTGGGTARLISAGWVIWAKTPNKFEAGTPAIINAIAFAKALLLIRQFGDFIFWDMKFNTLPADEILYHDELENYSGGELLKKLRQTLIGRGVRVPTYAGEKPSVNLDNGASTPTFAPIWRTVCNTWQQSEQTHQEIIHEVKSICAGFLNAPQSSYDTIFTSNTTEAINLVAENMKSISEQDVEPLVLNTLLEHNSNELPWRMIPGFSLIRQPVDAEGFIDLNDLEALLCEYNHHGQHGKKRIKLVAVSGASNVLGVYNRLKEISRIAHNYGAHILVDAAQMVAHRKVDMDACGIDYLAFSAHKVYAPFGSGALLVRKGLLNFSTSEMDQILSSGEENAVGIAALGKALVLLQRIGLDLIQEEEQALTAQALHGLAQIPGLTIYGIKDPGSPVFSQKGGVIVFRLQNMMANQVAKKLAEQAGIAVRYGCHCAHLLIKSLLHIPPLLERFQGVIVTLFSGISLPGLTRVSLGIENSREDIETLIDALGRIAGPTQSKADKRSTSRVNVTPASTQTGLQVQMNKFSRDVAQRVYSQLRMIQ
jgi:selenocysteine lyase/cysteine desulfurase